MAIPTTAERPRRKPAWATLAGNVALALLALGVALFLAELMVRLTGFSYTVYVWTDPVRGMAHIPGAKSVRQSNGRPWVEINSDGWRGPEVPLAAAPGTFRIALLGDSYIEAFEVPFEKTVGELLEGRLSALRGTPVEVLNFGHGGYGTTQELLTLQHEVWKYSPDLVLLAVTTGNDISDNSRRLKGIDYVPYHVFQGDRLVLDTSFRQSEGYRSRALWTQRLLVLIQHSRLA
ncbi:MAG TPA: SGNH/GDSL hydrolase family protein, partial [Gemmatimonadales bacterium]|nr:SGNH/GDSL hydrolase family protein [Gemmatimonadales bacterium]